MTAAQVEVVRFNTASGRHCCNFDVMEHGTDFMKVSIPQAVGTVATLLDVLFNQEVYHGFNTASGRHCCNSGV